MLNFLVPNIGNVGTWLSSGSGLRYIAFDVSVRVLRADSNSDIVNKGKWIPSAGALKDFYVITEVIQVTRLVIKVNKEAKAGARVQLNLTDQIPAGAGAGAGAAENFSQISDGNLIMRGVLEDGKPEPFPIAYRTAHIVHNPKDWTLKKPMELGVRRGDDDGLYIYEFVAKDEEFHIKEFFLKPVKEEDVDNDEEEEEYGGHDEDDEEELKLVPLSLSNEFQAQLSSFKITCKYFKVFIRF